MVWFIGPKLVYVVALCSILLIIVCGWEECDDIHYTNSWAVHIENGEPQVADRIAKRHGFINLGQVLNAFPTERVQNKRAPLLLP